MTGSRIGVVGPVESKVRADIEALVTEHAMGEALAALAISLAQHIDSGRDPKAIPAMARELRATLTELAKFEASGDEDDDLDLGTPTMGDTEDEQP